MLIEILSYYFLGAYLVMLLFSILMQFESFYEYCINIVSLIKTYDNIEPDKLIWKVLFGLSVLSVIGLLILLFVAGDYLFWKFKK